MACRHERIAREHDTILELRRRLASLDSAEAPCSVFQLFAETLLFIESHFMDEEDEMAASRYHDAAAHKGEHDEARRMFGDASMNAAGEAELAEFLSLFLNVWCSRHLETCDQHLFDHLAIQGAIRGAAAES